MVGGVSPFAGVAAFWALGMFLLIPYELVVLLFKCPVPADRRVVIIGFVAFILQLPITFREIWIQLSGV